MKTYIQKIRQWLGNESFIHPAARIIVENDNNEFLAIIKVNTGQLGLPAGAMEEEERIEDCIRREVWEETGLQLGSITVIGISSEPSRESVAYPNGDKIQYFTVEFYANEWSGNLYVNDPSEVKKALFVPMNRFMDLPPNERSAFESLSYFKKNNTLMLK